MNGYLLMAGGAIVLMMAAGFVWKVSRRGPVARYNVEHHPGGWRAWEDDTSVPAPNAAAIVRLVLMVLGTVALLFFGLGYMTRPKATTFEEPLPTLAQFAAESTEESTPEMDGTLAVESPQAITAVTATATQTVSMVVRTHAPPTLAPVTNTPYPTYTPLPTYTPYPTPVPVVIHEQAAPVVITAPPVIIPRVEIVQVTVPPVIVPKIQTVQVTVPPVVITATATCSATATIADLASPTPSLTITATTTAVMASPEPETTAEALP